MPRRVVSKSNEGGENPDYKALPAAMIGEQITESVFGAKKAESIISSLLKEHVGDRIRVIEEYMAREFNERVKGLAPAERRLMEDAVNVYAALPNPIFIDSGRDIVLLMKSLEDSAAKGYENHRQREVLAKVYMQVRRRVIPEKKDEAKTYVTPPITESVFGPEKSEEMIAKLLRKHGPMRVEAFLGFMKAELGERMHGLPQDERDKWVDAQNMYAVLPTAGFVESGRDMDFLREGLEHSRIRGYSNLSQRGAISRLYVQVRRRIFPDAPEGQINLKTQPITESVFGAIKSEDYLTFLMERYKGDRFEVLRDFMREEIVERGKGVSNEDKGKWVDAGNVYAPFLLIREFITTGHDAGILIQTLEQSRAGGYDNIPEREALAKVYTQVRRRLFPEIPEDKDFRMQP